MTSIIHIRSAGIAGPATLTSLEQTAQSILHALSPLQQAIEEEKREQ